MTIHIGTAEANAIKIGGADASAVYAGTEQVWPIGAPETGISRRNEEWLWGNHVKNESSGGVYTGYPWHSEDTPIYEGFSGNIPWTVVKDGSGHGNLQFSASSTGLSCYVEYSDNGTSRMLFPVQKVTPGKSYSYILNGGHMGNGKTQIWLESIEVWNGGGVGGITQMGDVKLIFDTGYVGTDGTAYGMSGTFTPSASSGVTTCYIILKFYKQGGRNTANYGVYTGFQNFNFWETGTRLKDVVKKVKDR